MKQTIKYAAVIFAFILAASIIGGCLTAGVAVFQMIAEKTELLEGGDGNGIWYRDEDGDVVFLGMHFSGKGDVKSGTEEFNGSDITSLDFEVMSGELEIETWGENYISVSYEDIPENYRIYNDNGTLVIEKEEEFFVLQTSFVQKARIQVSVPEDMTFREIKIEKGSGAASVCDIRTEKLHMESGSGAVTVSNCVLGETSMDTGSGSVTLANVTAKNLVVESGSGRVDFSGTLTGNSVLDTGSGSINMELLGKQEDYNIRADLGSGGMYINGSKVKNTNIEHDGADNMLIFDTGSGRVSIEFKEK